jgi:hypothetical protein
MRHGCCAAGLRPDLCLEWVIRDRAGRSYTTSHVRFASKADKRRIVSVRAAVPLAYGGARTDLRHNHVDEPRNCAVEFSPEGRLRKARHCCSLYATRGRPGRIDELPELQCKRAGGGKILLGMRRAAAARLPRMRPRQSRLGKILLGMRRATGAGCFPSLARNQGRVGERAAALCLRQGLHTKASCTKNSHLARDARRRTQAGDGAVRGLERLDGADRRTRSGGGACDPRASASIA